MHEKILVVDDDPAMQVALRESLRAMGYTVELVSSAEEALKRARAAVFDLIILDVMLPGMSGTEAIPEINALGTQGEIIVITAQGSKDTALDAIRSGAYDYFNKPFSLKEMEVIVRRALERRRLLREIEELRSRVQRRETSGRIVGQSEAIKRLDALIERIAPIETTVLVTGESGTGKELVADVIHSRSKRAEGPFIKINCAAIPENLLESELFGYEKGAFTGAHTRKPGKFELAQHGTILLDEIGDMPLSLQVKLLRVVEQKQVETLGGKKPVPVDVRIIAATNKDIPALIQEKQFREDLYYRLNVASIHIPPLRERKEDLPLLIQHFLREINVKLGTDISGISREAMAQILLHDWPGNIRELANTLERAVIFSVGNILSSASIELAFRRYSSELVGGMDTRQVSVTETLQEVEKTLILDALEKSGGVQTEAARMLGLNPKNLWKKIRKHSIHVYS